MNLLPNRPSPAEFAAWIDADIAASADPRAPIVVTDRDGTVASVDWVRPSDDGKTGWHRFNMGLPFDAPVPYVVSLLEAIPCGVDTFMFSGRAQGDKKGETFRYWQMLAWIAKSDLKIAKLLMRQAGDQRPDDIIKGEFVDVVSEKYRIVCAIDDRDSVCAMWRARGIPLVQVVDPAIPPLLMASV